MVSSLALIVITSEQIHTPCSFVIDAATCVLTTAKCGQLVYSLEGDRLRKLKRPVVL